MSDPERISKRSSGLAAQLLRAGAEERPSVSSMERTFSALAASGAVVTAASGATAAFGAGTAVAATTTKTMSGLVLAKWTLAGVLGGVALSGGAAAVSAPAPSPNVAVASSRAQTAPAKAIEIPRETPVTELTPVAVAAGADPTNSPLPVPAPSALASTAASEEALEVGAPLAAEVLAIDRARSLLASGDAERGLAELRRYEHDFPQARLLPEVLFLRMETLARLGRDEEARAAAKRLLRGFPHSPHAARARKLSGE